MQTFLPYPSFSQSLACLDDRRLGKQRVEAYQILHTLTGKSSGWRHHPAVKMWKGYEGALRYYLTLAITEWRNRGFNNTMERYSLTEVFEMPHWLGNEDFHRSHQSNLLRKDSEFYGRYGWNVPDNLPYVWPKGKEK